MRYWDLIHKELKKNSYEEKQWATRKVFSINSRVKLVKIVSSLPTKLHTHTYKIEQQQKGNTEEFNEWDEEGYRNH